MLLLPLFSILLFSLIFLFFFSYTNVKSLNFFGLFITGFVLIYSCILYINFDFNNPTYQFITHISTGNTILNLDFFLGLMVFLFFFFINNSFNFFMCSFFMGEF